MTEQEFLDKQRSILAEIEAEGEAIRKGKEVKGKTGLVSKLPEEGMEERGYMVWLGYKSIGRISGFTNCLKEKINDPAEHKKTKPVKFISYQACFDNVHTNFGIYNKRTVAIESDDIDATVIGKVGGAVSNLFTDQLRLNKEDRMRRPDLYFDRFIHDQNTIIARPTRSRNFFQWMQAIGEKAEFNGIDLKHPPMSHITIARFKQNIPYEELGSFNEMMDAQRQNHDPDVSNWDTVPAGLDYGTAVPNPISINVGTYKYRHDDFVLEPFSSFRIDKYFLN